MLHAPSGNYFCYRVAARSASSPLLKNEMRPSSCLPNLFDSRLVLLPPPLDPNFHAISSISSSPKPQSLAHMLLPLGLDNILDGNEDLTSSTSRSCVPVTLVLLEDGTSRLLIGAVCIGAPTPKSIARRGGPCVGLSWSDDLEDVDLESSIKEGEESATLEWSLHTLGSRSTRFLLSSSSSSSSSSFSSSSSSSSTLLLSLPILLTGAKYGSWGSWGLSDLALSLVHTLSNKEKDYWREGQQQRPLFLAERAIGLFLAALFEVCFFLLFPILRVLFYFLRLLIYI